MHLGHDDQDNGGAGTAAAGIGHNAPPRQKPAQWQQPHMPPDAVATAEGAAPEADLDLVERAFAEAFVVASDPTSFLRLARVPLEAKTPAGTRLVLLRVEVEGLTDVGSVTPQLGGGGFRYDPLPAKIVSHRRRLAFAYFDGATVQRLAFDEVRRLEPAG